MFIRNWRFAPWRAIRILAGLLTVAAFAPQAAHAAKWYVDKALGEVRPDERAVPARPRPVQLLFEFQRDGGPNPKATKLVRPWAVETLQATGAFTEITDLPASDGAVLSIKFNNLVKKEEIDKAKHDGFRAGLGFGLFGGVVATDHYVVTLTYVPVTGAAPITNVVSHAIHMKYGKKDVEIPGTEVKNVNEAVRTVVRQALARGVNNIVTDPAFPK
jgi:hypothetical protein